MASALGLRQPAAAFRPAALLRTPATRSRLRPPQSGSRAAAVQRLAPRLRTLPTHPLEPIFVTPPVTPFRITTAERWFIGSFHAKNLVRHPRSEPPRCGLFRSLLRLFPSQVGGYPAGGREVPA